MKKIVDHKGSPYELELQQLFNKKLKEHLSKPKVKARLVRTGKMMKEIKKFAKVYDRKYLTEFYDIITKGY